MSEIPESSTPEPNPEPAEPPSGGLPPKAGAVIACAFPFVGGIVMLLLERKDRFVRFYAIQSIFLALLWVAAKVAFAVGIHAFHLLPVVGGILAWAFKLAWLLLALLFFVIYIVQIVKAASGVEWEVPYVGPLARGQMKET